MFEITNDASIKKHYDENVTKLKIASKNIVNIHNSEVYIATSPDELWKGRDGTDYTFSLDKSFMNSTSELLFNMDAFGIFNDAYSALTAKCNYNKDEHMYEAYINYYLIDYYDFDKLELFNELNALGMACSYELYGFHDKTIKYGMDSGFRYKE